jgi:hypothetical protein
MSAAFSAEEPRAWMTWLVPDSGTCDAAMPTLGLTTILEISALTLSTRAMDRPTASAASLSSSSSLLLGSIL